MFAGLFEPVCFEFVALWQRPVALTQRAAVRGICWLCGGFGRIVTIAHRVVLDVVCSRGICSEDHLVIYVSSSWRLQVLAVLVRRWKTIIRSSRGFSRSCGFRRVYDPEYPV
jgi:hypothetical protein